MSQINQTPTVPQRPHDKLSAFEHRYIHVGMSVLTIVGFTVFLLLEMWRLLEPIIGLLLGTVDEPHPRP